jgi:hypothetical protein
MAAALEQAPGGVHVRMTEYPPARERQARAVARPTS